MTSVHLEPLVCFNSIFKVARAPQRADRSAGGVLPTRAFRYCEALTTASALGWYIFPPLNFSLYWDGNDVFWSYDGDEAWQHLGSAQFPYFSECFNKIVPERVRNYAPPFLAALPESGVVQVWSGLIARTRPGWSLLVRPPANLPRTGGYDLFEGVVETDTWFGPLFTNIRLTRTNSPISFQTDVPLFQAQPLHRTAYSDQTLNDFVLNPSLETLTEADWTDYYNTVVRASEQVACPLGRNAADVRRRRRKELLPHKRVYAELGINTYPEPTPGCP